MLPSKIPESITSLEQSEETELFQHSASHPLNAFCELTEWAVAGIPTCYSLPSSEAPSTFLCTEFWANHNQMWLHEETWRESWENEFEIVYSQCSRARRDSAELGFLGNALGLRQAPIFIWECMFSKENPRAHRHWHCVTSVSTSWQNTEVSVTSDLSALKSQTHSRFWKCTSLSS